MIIKADLSPLMQRTVDKGITFMISQSGQPGYYNLHFAKYVLSNKAVHLQFHEEEQTAYQYADGEHPVIAFNNIDEVLAYVSAGLDVEAKEETD